MKLVFFEDIFEEQVKLIPEMEINANVSRKPSFGWGDSDALRKFLAFHKEKHNPLIWSVPAEAVPSGELGLIQRKVTLNLCAIETNTEMLNSTRMNPNRSFKKVLRPLWEQIERRLDLSDITMADEVPAFQPFPDYKVPSDANEGQFIWDVLRVKFEVTYSEEKSLCNY